MEGRDSRRGNDLFYTCSLIDYIARKTKNRRRDVVNALGEKNVSKIYELADVYHSDNIERVSDDFIAVAKIAQGEFDNISTARFSVPSHWDIGKVFRRLVLGIVAEEGRTVVDALFAAYNSFVTEKIEDFNSSFYYDAPGNILNAYLDGKIEQYDCGDEPNRSEERHDRKLETGFGGGAEI